MRLLCIPTVFHIYGLPGNTECCYSAAANAARATAFVRISEHRLGNLAAAAVVIATGPKSNGGRIPCA